MKTKEEKVRLFDSLAASRRRWKKKNYYYYQTVEKLHKFLIPEKSKVIELGCGTGELLNSCNPVIGLGLDFSEQMIAIASRQFGDNFNISWIVADAEAYIPDQPYDYVIMSDLLGESSDVWRLFNTLHSHCTSSTKLVISYFNPLWEPILRLAEKLGLKMPQDYQNWLTRYDIENLLALTDFETIKFGRQMLFPWKIPIISEFVNRYIAQLPLVNTLCLINYTVAHKKCNPTVREDVSVSVVIPCRNEEGNIENSIDRIPQMGSHTEIIYVDGNSNDGTVAAINTVIEKHKGIHDIRLIHQLPQEDTDGATHGKMLKLGKGDAVRKGFAAASGEVLMILDADLTVMPEELPRFYHALLYGNAEFINGTRLVYPMEKEAMRFLNKIANKLFALAFSWILGQRIKDTLCGTKVLYRSDYEAIARNRAYFGDFDPFGDFDLLFGAAKLNFKIVDMPVHYVERVSGEIKIERFRHGLLLLKMVVFSLFRLKFR